MPGQMSEATAPVSPSRSGRHQVTRSISELTRPGKPKGHQTRHSIHHHLRKEKHHRHHDERVPQSAHVTRSRHSLDMPHPEAPAHSRRNSALVVPMVENASRVSSNHQSVDSKSKKVDNEEKLKKERENAVQRAEDLKQSLVHLHSFSINASRRLDQTYYAVLEKMSALQNTISALRDLADSSRDIYGSFEKGSRAIETDITNQIDGIGRFDEQQAKIEGLRSRIHDGRARVQTLSARVDAVRERVESWERADQHWQERTRRRLKYIWTVMSLTSLLTTVLFMFYRFGTSDISAAGLDETVASAAELPGYGLPNASDRTPSLLEEVDNQAEEPLLWTKPIRDDDRLRGLDEL